MHTVRVSIEAKKKADWEKITDSINGLLGALRMNVQILGNQFPTAQTKSGLEFYANTPDKDSLSKKYNNKYVNKYLAQISDYKIKKPQITVLGKEIDSASLCDCKKLNDFVLFTTYVSLESPLRCFKCFGVVPLYKIPKTYDGDEYYNVISWQSDYQSCDSLQMNCTVGERFAINQLSKYDSPLNKQGLSVCESIEKVTGGRVFYYLYKGTARSHKAELLRKCPNCGGDWLLEEPFHRLFDFKCEKCKLLSNIAFGVRK